MSAALSVIVTSQERVKNLKQDLENEEKLLKEK
jgi:hypothetical protein